jgi:hypothetical protein
MDKHVNRHECEDFDAIDHDSYGPSITAIERGDDGRWWAWSREEYSSAIRFCPFCGERLP